MTSDWKNRVLALIPLVTLALLWSNHHLGAGAGYPGVVAAVAASLPIAIGIAEKLLDNGTVESKAAAFREWIARHLSWRLIVVLYLAGAIVALVWTSVVVIADDAGAQGPIQVKLVAADALSSGMTQDLESKGEPVRFIVASNPFGRVFRLHVDGYVPETFEIYSISGRRIRPSKDLRRSPTVLMRLSHLAVGSFTDQTGGELMVLSTLANGVSVEVARSREPRAAFLLGRKQPVPSSYAANWRTELLAMGVNGDVLVARHLVGWRDPAVLHPAVVLEPGMHLRVQVVNSAANVVASSEFVLGDGELQDQFVEDVK